MQTNTAQGAFTLITYAIGHNQMTAPGGAKFTTMGRSGHTSLNVARRLVLAKGGAEPVTVRHYLPDMDPEADATLIRTQPDDQPHSSPDLTLLALKALLPLAEARVMLTLRRDPWARKAEAAIAFAHTIQSGASIEEAVPLLLAYQAACYTATEQLHAAGVGHGPAGGRRSLIRGAAMIEVNPDGVSIKGCSYIYAPAGQAGEYAPLAANPYRGCGHKCAYCYVPAVIKMPRAEFDAGAVPRPGFLGALTRDAAKYREAGIREQVMLSFTTDPYHPGDNSLTRATLETLAAHGLAFCTLTKGGHRALRDIDLFRPDRDAFASTLTSLDNAVSLKWERGAAPAGDRVETLRIFHDRGIFTWVSLEPTLDCDASLEIVEKTHRFVDLYKVGRVNYSGLTKTIDWMDYTQRMIDLLGRLGAAHYIKRDLQPYLPEGYHNPLRVPQHH